MNNLFEVEGLGKGLGQVGSKLSKSIGLPGVNIGSNVKAIQPSPEQTADPAQEMTPEEQTAAAQAAAPEAVEKLPKPMKIEYDSLGSPNKNTLIGHVVRRGDKEYVLDWDAEYDVYKLVDPDTLRVKTRVRPASISTVDFRAGTVKESLTVAVTAIQRGVPVVSLIEHLLNGRST